MTRQEVDSMPPASSDPSRGASRNVRIPVVEIRVRDREDDAQRHMKQKPPEERVSRDGQPAIDREDDKSEQTPGRPLRERNLERLAPRNRYPDERLAAHFGACGEEEDEQGPKAERQEGLLPRKAFQHAASLAPVLPPCQQLCEVRVPIATCTRQHSTALQRVCPACNNGP